MATTTEQASAIRKRAAAQIDTLRGDKDLTDTGRQRQVERVKQETSDALRDLRLAEQRELEDRRETLVGRILRNPQAHEPGSALAYRDAQDRAAAIKNGSQAATAMQRAQRTGDASMARAIASRALEVGDFGGSGWSDALTAWTSTVPFAQDAVDELTQLAAADSTRGRLQRALATSVGGLAPDPRRLPASAEEAS